MTCSDIVVVPQVEELSRREYPVLKEFIRGTEDAARCERVRERIKALKQRRALPGSSNFVFFKEVMGIVHSREGDASVHWVLKDFVEAWYKARSGRA